MKSIYIAFGFHVNLYHSFRGDSNDDAGFGGDIRVIRNTIDVLNRHNRLGVPVKGTWDIENAYSLERILPEYAPDIIHTLRDRIRNNGDENILMGYNNGLLSGMDDEEFRQSVIRAISNDKNSGLKDIFGSCYPMIRPQEVMFTPSQVTLYNQLGIKAVCLYYSAVIFDGFRTLIPQLPEKYAYNPLWYTYNGDKIALIPMLNHGDLLEFGSLRAMVKSLHKKQLSGEIDTDLLLFINMDADSEFWYGYGLKGIPNMEGLEGLINEVKNLEYVVFDTPGHYLDSHTPAHSVSFTQDTADGSFDGYTSWSEKPFNHMIWSRLEKARLLDKKVQLEKSMLSDEHISRSVELKQASAFEKRLRLLSTTHFGLSSPVLNITRENTALQLSEEMLNDIAEADQLIGRAFFPHQTTDTHSQARLSVICMDSCTGTHFTVEFKKGIISDISALKVTDVQGSTIQAAFLDTGRYEDGSIHKCRVFIPNSGCKGIITYILLYDYANRISSADNEYVAGSLTLTERSASNGNISLKLNTDHEVISFEYNGVQIGGEDFIKKYIRYRYGKKDKEYSFKTVKKVLLTPGKYGCLSGFRFYGEIVLPGCISNGSYIMDLFFVEHIPSLFVRMDINYPYTHEGDTINNELASLQRYCDERWIEAAPFQLAPALKGNISVIKRNYHDDVSRFLLHSFIEADKDNSYLSSFNNAITNGFAGVCGEDMGLLVSVDRNTLSSSAFCPMRADLSNGKEAVCLNPFGTYYGKQRHHTTYGNSTGYELTLATAVQLKSVAPAYNGVHSQFIISLIPFNKQQEGDAINIAISFSEPNPVAIQSSPDVWLSLSDNVSRHHGEPERDKFIQAEKRTTTSTLPLGLKIKVLCRALLAKYFNRF